jgi:iron complex outermembrane receptor protein
VVQPGLSASGFSPKLSLAWDAGGDWILTGSLGRAYRFPTVRELYQSVTTGATLSSPNPALQPENALSGEFAVERASGEGRVRLSVFGEDIANALISQTTLLNGASASFVQNVDRVRSKGVELAASRDNVLLRGLEIGGSLTYVDARVVRDAAYPTAVGKTIPQVPNWRATVLATWRPNDQVAATIAARYQGRMYASIENWDGYGHTYQGFEGFFMVDARLRYRLDRHWTAAVGVDNLNNQKVFLFHPFPQRALAAELKYTH